MRLFRECRFIMNPFKIHINIFLIAKYFQNLKLELKYVIVGCVNTLFCISSYPVIYYINIYKLNYIILAIINSVVCVTFSYLNLKFFVFESKGDLYKEYFSFLFYNCIVFCLNLVFLYILVDNLHCSPVIVQPLLVIFFALIGFLFNKNVTFKIK